MKSLSTKDLKGQSRKSLSDLYKKVLVDPGTSDIAKRKAREKLRLLKSQVDPLGNL